MTQGTGQSHFLVVFPACTWISTEALLKTTATTKPKHVYSGVTLWRLDPSLKILVMKIIYTVFVCLNCLFLQLFSPLKLGKHQCPLPHPIQCGQGPAHNWGSQSGFLLVTEVDLTLFTYPWFPQLPSEVPTFFYELLEEYISLEIPFSADRNPAFLYH